MITKMFNKLPKFSWFCHVSNVSEKWKFQISHTKKKYTKVLRYAILVPECKQYKSYFSFEENKFTYTKV